MVLCFERDRIIILKGKVTRFGIISNVEGSILIWGGGEMDLGEENISRDLSESQCPPDSFRREKELEFFIQLSRLRVCASVSGKEASCVNLVVKKLYRWTEIEHRVVSNC